MDVWAIFTDLDKAYDTVMWQILRRYGVLEELILVLRNMYLYIVTKIKGCGKNVRIPSTVGVK